MQSSMTSRVKYGLGTRLATPLLKFLATGLILLAKAIFRLSAVPKLVAMHQPDTIPQVSDICSIQYACSHSYARLFFQCVSSVSTVMQLTPQLVDGVFTCNFQ